MTPQTLADIILQALEHLVGFFDHVNAYQRHIRFGYFRFLHHMFYKTVFPDLRHAKIPWIVHFSYTDHRIRTFYHFLYIVLTDRITEDNEYFIIIHNIPREADRMTHTLPVDLVNIMRR